MQQLRLQEHGLLDKSQNSSLILVAMKGVTTGHSKMCVQYRIQQAFRSDKFYIEWKLR